MASLNPNLADFWFVHGAPIPECWIKARYRVLYGGRMSSKSWEFAGMAANLAQQCRTRFLCVRRFQNKIKESVYTLVKAQIENFGFSGFDIRATDIQHANGSEFVFYGIQHNTDEIKSFEGADILWIEEAHNLTKEQWRILEPTIMRNQGAEIWISFNPRFVTDFIYQRFIINPPKGARVRLVNYPDNPFLPATAIETIEQLKAEDDEEYRHVYLGEPLGEDGSAVIKRAWIEAEIGAFDALGIGPIGPRRVGYDVADSGADKNATAVFRGGMCFDMDEWKAPEDELRESAMRAWSHVRGGMLIYDSIGVGAHVGSTLKTADIASGYYKFNAGGAVVHPKREYTPGVKNGEKFENLKAQAWQDVADRFRNTYNAITKGTQYSSESLISIAPGLPHLERLKTELCSPRKSFSKRGLDMVETKDSLAKRGIPSPNLADAFVMGACPHLATGGYSLAAWG